MTNAELSNGLLTISLIRAIPEAMKPLTIAITSNVNAIEHGAGERGGKSTKAA